METSFGSSRPYSVGIEEEFQSPSRAARQRFSSSRKSGCSGGGSSQSNAKPCVATSAWISAVSAATLSSLVEVTRELVALTGEVALVASV